jgi:hypothetical protein
MKLEMNIQIPLLWPGVFTKSHWAPVNYIVGPNGSGKSLLAEQILSNLRMNSNGLKVRHLTAERLSGFEKNNYSYYSNSQINQGLDVGNSENLKTYGSDYGLSTPGFVLLKERLDIRIKIEAMLSDILKKKIRLAEEGGFLKPKIQNIGIGEEYGIKESECHGLKELITILTFIYDASNSILIVDEPELHGSSAE